MAAVANLKSDTLAVQPGQATTTELSIINTGTIVEQFTILLLGDVAAWTTVEPPVVSLFPQGQQTVKVTFAPPRHHLTPSGPIEFAVKVIPANEPEESVVEEGVITVGSFNDIGAELVPRVATGRLAGKQRLAVDSRGNVPVPVELTAFDAADGMKFHIRPKRVVAAPGEARFARVKVRPRQRFWKGPNQQKPYKVQVAPEGEKPLVLDGAMTQKAVLPKWLLPLLALLAALVLLWFLVLRPIVKSTAVTANAAALAAQAADNKRLSTQLAATQATVQALTGAKPAASAAKPASPAATPGATTTTATTTAGGITINIPTSTTSTTVAPTTGTTQPPPVTGPNDGQIEVVSPVGQSPGPINFFTALGKGASLQITDLVVTNQQPGSAGTLSIQRSTPGPNNTNKVQPLLTLPFTSPSGYYDPGITGDDQYHFNTPILFTAGQRLQLTLNCSSGPVNPNTETTGVASAPGTCDFTVYYDGPGSQPGGGATTTTSIPGP